jgi:hypothetical protein
MFSNEFIAYIDNIHRQSIDKDGYKFIELFETKFMKEKKLFKSHPDGSNSYYFDMNFAQNPQDNSDTINYKYYQKYIKDIIKTFEEHGFNLLRRYIDDNICKQYSMTFSFDDEYHYDNITKIKTIRFFFRY